MLTDLTWKVSLYCTHCHIPSSAAYLHDGIPSASIRSDDGTLEQVPSPDYEDLADSDMQLDCGICGVDLEVTDVELSGAFEYQPFEVEEV